MNGAGWDIEWIVREVVRRVREQAPAAIAPRAKTPENPANSQEKQDATRFVLSERLVTLDTIKAKLNGIKTVQVVAKAIVTPAVKDELKQRKIALVRDPHGDTSKQAFPKSQAKLVIASTASNADAGKLLKQVGQPAEEMNVHGRTLTQVMEEYVAALTDDRLGVLFCETPAAAVVLANRHTSLRAALATNFPAIRSAIAEVNANLLVIEPQRRSETELATMISEFTRGRN